MELSLQAKANGLKKFIHYSMPTSAEWKAKRDAANTAKRSDVNRSSFVVGDEDAEPGRWRRAIGSQTEDSATAEHSIPKCQ